jgi:hypothetical protein
VAIAAALDNMTTTWDGIDDLATMRASGTTRPCWI